MNKKTLTIVGVPVAVIVFMCGVIVGIPLMYFGTAAGCTAMGGTVPIGDSDGVEFGPWGGNQVANAAAILQQGQRDNIPVFGWQVALAVAMQESSLRVLANPEVPESYDYPHDGEGTDHDSVGLFQQRPSQGWGTVAELMDPEFSAKKFYDALMAVEGWTALSLTEAAQVVQKSAFPDAYADWEDEATDLMEFLTGQDLEELLNDRSGVCEPGVVGPQGWIAPVSAPIWSTYQDPDRDGNHFGIDLGADRGTPIYAAAAGVVLHVECQSSVGCDVDGSRDVSGCGWHVEISHGELYDPSSTWPGIATHYCHLDSQPLVVAGELVKAGQVIGYVGNTGNSSAPHLHYEVHSGLDEMAYQRPSNETSIDPEPWHVDVEAPLGVVEE